MITETDYYQSHDDKPTRDLRTEYSTSMTPEIEANARRTITATNALLADLGVSVPGLNSGWRPPAYNAKVPNAKKFSLHMSACAIDVTDHEGLIDEMLLHDWQQCFAAGTPLLSYLGKYNLWLEHPSQTKGWCHLQIKAQASYKITGNRVFYP